MLYIAAQKGKFKMKLVRAALKKINERADYDQINECLSYKTFDLHGVPLFYGFFHYLAACYAVFCVRFDAQARQPDLLLAHLADAVGFVGYFS